MQSFADALKPPVLNRMKADLERELLTGLQPVNAVCNEGMDGHSVPDECG